MVNELVFKIHPNKLAVFLVVIPLMFLFYSNTLSGILLGMSYLIWLFMLDIGANGRKQYKKQFILMLSVLISYYPWKQLFDSEFLFNIVGLSQIVFHFISIVLFILLVKRISTGLQKKYNTNFSFFWRLIIYPIGIWSIYEFFDTKKR